MDTSSRRILLYDGGCAPCSSIADEIRVRDLTNGGRLELESLRDDGMQALLDQARPNGWDWEPTFLQVSGDDVRVWTGLALVPQLVLTVGLRRAHEIATLVNTTGRTKSSMSRRSLLMKVGAVAAAIPLASLLGTGQVSASGRDLRHSPRTTSTMTQTLVSSPEFSEIAPRVLGVSPCEMSNWSLYRQPNARTVEPRVLFEEDVDGAAYGVYAFELLPTDTSDMGSFKLFPRALFATKDGLITNVVTVEPDIASASFIGKGVGRFSNLSDQRRPMPAALRRKVTETRSRTARDTTSSRSIIAAPTSAGSSAIRAVECGYDQCCYDYECVEYGVQDTWGYAGCLAACGVLLRVVPRRPVLRESGKL